MSDAERTPESAELAPSADVVRTLVESHREFLRFLERKVGSRAFAEDIPQDAFVRGIGRIDSLRDDESATAWFYGTLRNVVAFAEEASITHREQRGRAPLPRPRGSAQAGGRAGPAPTTKPTGGDHSHHHGHTPLSTSEPSHAH